MRPRIRLRVVRWILLAVLLLAALILLLLWILRLFSRTQPPSLTGYVNESIRSFVQSLPATTSFPSDHILIINVEGNRREIEISADGTPHDLVLSPEGGYALLTLTSAQGGRRLVRVDLTTGQSMPLELSEAYTHYSWVDEETFVLYPSRLSEETPLWAVDCQSMQTRSLLTLETEQFSDEDIERIELGALTWDAAGRRYLLVSNVYDVETHTASLVVCSYKPDGTFIERLIEKRDMQMPTADSWATPQVASIRSGAIAINAIERVQGTPYNRILLYDSYGRLERASAGVSLQTGLPASFYDQNVFAAVSDPVEGDRQDGGNRIWQMREQLADSVAMDAESLGARAGQVYGVASADGETFILAAYIELTPAATKRTHMLFRYEMDKPGSIEPIAALPSDTQFGGVTPNGDLVLLTGEAQLTLPDLAERPPIETEEHEGYTAADYTLLRQSAGPGSHEVYFQGTVSTRISDQSPYTTLTVHTVDGAYQITNYNTTTLQLRLFAGSYIKVYGHTTGAADAKGVIPIAADYVYAQDGSSIDFSEYNTINDCVVAQDFLLERNAQNGYGQRFYLLGTVTEVAEDAFCIDGKYVLRHVTEGIETGMTLGIEAIFSAKEEDRYIFYPEVIRQGEEILYNGTERTLENPGLFARCVGETLIGAAEGTIVRTPMLVGDRLACDLLSAAELSLAGHLQEISTALRSFALQLGDEQAFSTLEINLFLLGRATDATPSTGFGKVLTLTIPLEDLFGTGWSTIGPSDYIDRGWLHLLEGDLSEITEEAEPVAIPSQILFSLSLDGEEEVTTLASLGEGQRYSNPVYLSDLNKIAFLHRGSALMSENEVVLTDPSLAAYSFVSGRVENYGEGPVQFTSITQVGQNYVYLGRAQSPTTVSLLNLTSPEAEPLQLEVGAQIEVLSILQDPSDKSYLVVGALKEDSATGKAGDILLTSYFGNGKFKSQMVTGLSRTGAVQSSREGAVYLGGTILIPSLGPGGDTSGLSLWNLEEGLVTHFTGCRSAVAVEMRTAYAMVEGEKGLLIAGADGQLRYRVSADQIAEAVGVDGLTIDRIYTVPHMHKIILIAVDADGGRYALSHEVGKAGSTTLVADLREYEGHLIAGVSMGEELLLVTPFELPAGMHEVVE